MKKTIIAAVMLGFSLHGQAETLDEPHTAELENLKMPAIGALAGALLAGPPGVMVGIMGGALIGHIERQEDQIERVNGELAVEQKQVNSLELTRLRAEQVIQRLVDAGISPERIKTKVEGKGLALYPENDTEGLGFDRYVVLSLLPGDAL